MSTVWCHTSNTADELLMECISTCRHLQAEHFASTSQAVSLFSQVFRWWAPLPWQRDWSVFRVSRTVQGWLHRTSEWHFRFIVYDTCVIKLLSFLTNRNLLIANWCLFQVLPKRIKKVIRIMQLNMQTISTDCCCLIPSNCHVSLSQWLLLRLASLHGLPWYVLVCSSMHCPE